jgi:hypothetical protein
MTAISGLFSRPASIRFEEVNAPNFLWLDCVG